MATFSEMTSKTAVEKSCKGLGISDDAAGYLKSLIPVDRGMIWSLKDCLEGNPKKERKPVRDFINEINKYPGLKECALALEGIIVGRGLHAAGLIISNEPYTNYISCMRAPNGDLCTCYDLQDCEDCGIVKVDMLTVKASDKLRTTMDLLIEYKYLEWQGTLKATYDKYLHPDVINYDNPAMWGIIKDIYSLFQFDTPVSANAINVIQPKNLMELSATNSLLRLMGSGETTETPLERYARYADIHEWEKDCHAYGLVESEMDVIRQYCSDSRMLPESQEKVMLISMDKRVAGFTLKQSNKLRKSIAKKDEDILEETRIMFFEHCIKQNTREIFAKYVWYELFGMSFGYSFSNLHSYAYSVIGLQELNVNYFYPPVFWACACLTVESSSVEENEEEYEDLERKKKNTGTNYEKMAKAIYRMKDYRINTLPPDINKSDLSFTPLVDESLILFGLGGITKMNRDVAKDIMSGRPYNSFKEFYDYQKNLLVPTGELDEKGNMIYRKSLVTKSIFATLIKAGCFDSLCDDKILMLKWLICWENPAKTTLTMANLSKCLELGCTLPKHLVKVYNFRKYVESPNFFYRKNEKFKTKKDYILEDKFARPFFEEHYINDLTEGKDFYYENDMLIVIDKSLDKVLKPELDELISYINNPSLVDEYNKKYWQQEYMNMVKYENIPKWSMETISFYPDKHELTGIDFEKYNISHYKDLPASPIFVEKSSKNGKRTWRQYDLSRICGVVLSRNDNKHFINLLTPDNDVVTVKFNEGQYAYYKKSISETEEFDEDTNWFKKGTLLMISGYRKSEDDEEEFIAKKYKNSVFTHSVIKIRNVNPDLSLSLQFERADREEE